MHRVVVVGLLLALGALHVPHARAACGDRPGDGAAIAAARLEIDAQCPCPSPRQRAFVECALAVVDKRIAAGSLRSQCRRAAARCARRSACGDRTYRRRLACFRTDARGVTQCGAVEDARSCSAPVGGGRSVTRWGNCCPCISSECLLRFFFTCGDPVCRVGGHHPRPGVSPCTTQRPGDPCRFAGERCDPGDDCNRHLLCTGSDPTGWGCPISRRRYKTDIRHLTPLDGKRLHDQLLRLPLATFRYRADNAGHPERLGFVIDEVGTSAAVDPSGEAVDLYGYVSMAVAAIQTQAREIERLKREVDQLRQELGSPLGPGSARPDARGTR